ncbi:MAG: glycosyltransferase [Candidatus Bathyarchaeum tardum]|nr:MAG: glycosyltransferase [Candidatus Bathyarchaeum tardum]
MTKYVVTLGVCVKNGEYHISNAIDAIMAQDFSHNLIQIIFVDDGSTDRTLSIIENSVSKLDMHVKIFHHSWKGLGYSRNVVFENADADYIIWVDCDMVLSPTFVSEQVEFMEQNHSVGIAKGKYGLYPDSNLVGFLENIEFVTKDLNISESVNVSLGTGGAIYRVKSLQEVGGFDSNIRGAGEDTDVEYRISKAGWLLFRTPAIFYEMRRKTWKALWDEYFRYGYDGNYVANKNGLQALTSLDKVFPLTAFLNKNFQSFVAYKLTHQKAVFLLPFHYFFKRTAWCLGFIIRHITNNNVVRNV